MSKTILIAEIFEESSGLSASRVLVDGKEMFCKALGSVGGSVGTSVGRESGCLQGARKLLPPGSNASMHVPQLLGYFRHAGADCVIEFVWEWVPGCSLKETDVPATLLQRRQKWMGQIREAVSTLHVGGMVWGDGKASNVVIDEQDDAWLIDFGGGWSNSWVDEELANTVEGDEQAVSKIETFLGVANV